MSGPLRRTGFRRPDVSPPSVDLLPAHLKVRMDNRRSIRRGWLGAGGAGVVTILAMGASFAMSAGARLELAEEEDRTAALAADRLQHAEVEELLDAATRHSAALEVITSTDIDWDRTLADIRSALPSDVAVSRMTMEAASVIEDLPEPPTLLATEPVATVKLTVESRTIPSVTAWIDGLAEVPGHIATLPGTTSEDDGVYSVEIVLHLDDAAFSAKEA